MTVFLTFRPLILAAATIAASACAAIPAHSEPPSAQAASAEERAALDLVARRIAAYNAHDIEAFLATYDEKVRIYIFPERFLGEGRERMRRIFGPQFARNDGAVKVTSQHVLENKVVSDEIVTISGAVEHNIAIYTISGGLISEVRLIEPGE